MSTLDPNDMRRKILEGYQPTEEEMSLIITNLIGDRARTLTTAASKPTKVKGKSTPVSLDDLFVEGGNENESQSS